MRRTASLSLPLFPPDAAPSPPAEPARLTNDFLSVSPANASRAELERLVARATEYAKDVRAASTRRAYDGSFQAFETWCAGHGLASLPATPATVATYLTALAGEGRRPATIERVRAAIVSAHRERGVAWPRTEPTVANVLRGIRRTHGVGPAQKAALGDDELAAMVAVLGDSLSDRRDRAVLTVGWLGAFRRSELVALRVEDLVHVPEGLLMRVRRAKGDQEGRGGEKAIPRTARALLCPVRALEAWLAASQITSGPIFRAVDRGGRVRAEALNDRSVARIVQRVASAASLDPSQVAAHSLRAGFITTAPKRGKRLDEIMRQTHQKSERGHLREQRGRWIDLNRQGNV